MSTTKRPTAAALANLSKKYTEAEANQGQGSLGPWPQEGEESTQAARVMGAIENWEAEFTYGKKGPSQKKVKSFTIQFLYEIDTPDKGPFAFKGKPFNIPYDIDALPETDNKQAGGKQQTRANIELDRLKGHLQALLGREGGDVFADITEALDGLNAAREGGAPTMANVKLTFPQRDVPGLPGQKPKVFTDKVEYITELLA